jgi:dTDP-glucose pyrophosphorylase
MYALRRRDPIPLAAARRMRDGMPPLGVILAADGDGGLPPLTPGIPKPLLPLVDRPMLDRAIDTIARIGVTEVVVVVGDVLTARCADALAPDGIDVDIVPQLDQRGSAHALSGVGSRLDRRLVAVLAVDAILRDDARASLSTFELTTAAAGIVLAPTDESDARRAVLEDDRITSYDRSSSDGPAGAGLWFLRDEAIAHVRTAVTADPTARLADILGSLVAGGSDVRGWVLEQPRLRIGTLGALLDAQRLLLLERDMESYVATDARVERCELDSVVVSAGAWLRDVTLRRSFVAPGASLEGGCYEDVVVFGDGEVCRRDGARIVRTESIE